MGAMSDVRHSYLSFVTPNELQSGRRLLYAVWVRRPLLRCYLHIPNAELCFQSKILIKRTMSSWHTSG